MRMLSRYICCLGLLSLPVTSMAEMSVYFGAEAGISKILLEELDDGKSSRFYAGFNFIEEFGVELSTGDLGEFDNNFTSNAVSSVEVDSVRNIVAIFNAPLIFVDKGHFHARYGIYQLNVKPNNLNGTDREDDFIGFTYAFGASYPFLGPLAATLNAQYFHDVDDLDIWSFSTGLRLEF